VKLAKFLDLRGCKKESDRVYIIFGKYIDKILVDQTGRLDIRNIVSFKQIKDDYGDSIILRIDDIRRRYGKSPVGSQAIIWKNEADKLRRKNNENLR